MRFRRQRLGSGRGTEPMGRLNGSHRLRRLSARETINVTCVQSGENLVLLRADVAPLNREFLQTLYHISKAKITVLDFASTIASPCPLEMSARRPQIQPQMTVNGIEALGQCLLACVWLSGRHHSHHPV